MPERLAERVWCTNSQSSLLNTAISRKVVGNKIGSSSTSLNSSNNWLWKQWKRWHSNAPIPEKKRQYCFSRPLKLEIYVRYWTTEKLCTRQSRKVIWDMIDILASISPWPLVLFFLSFFFWKTVNSKPPTIPFGIVACTFSDNLSRNSCIYFCLGVIKPSFLLIFFRYGPNIRSHCTIVWHRSYQKCGAPLSRSARCSFAP